MSDHDRLPPVSLLRLFLKMGGWVVIIFGAVLLAVTFIAQLSLMTAQRFEREGLPARAMVAERYTTESVDLDGDRSITYWLGLDYVTQAGEEINLLETVNSGEYRRVAVGDEIDILYLQSAPRRVEVTPGSHAQGAKVARIIGLVVGLMWLALLWVVGRWAVEAARARRFGERLEAKVTEVYRTAIRVNNRPRYRLKWKDHSGRTGQSLLRRRADVEHYKPGDAIRVYQGLKRQWWAGDTGDREAP